MKKMVLAALMLLAPPATANAQGFTAQTWADCSAETAIFGVLLSSARNRGAAFTLSDIEASDKEMEQWIGKMSTFVGVHRLSYLETLYETAITNKTDTIGYFIAKQGDTRLAWEQAIEQASIRRQECMTILNANH
ncbi:MAG: hypothetical protein CSA68_09305 [Rhodobacterales bacterium]|nr:MAG: hypothetical protein CSA68_09305 [Rhodobacterales bacterium]